MNQYTVDCCADGIYAGIMKPTKDDGTKVWKVKSKCTENAIGAVKRWMQSQAEVEGRSAYKIIFEDPNLNKTSSLVWHEGTEKDAWKDIKKSVPSVEDAYLVLIERPWVLNDLIDSTGEYYLAYMSHDKDGNYKFVTSTNEDVTKMVKFWAEIPEFNREDF